MHVESIINRISHLITERPVVYACRSADPHRRSRRHRAGVMLSDYLKRLTRRDVIAAAGDRRGQLGTSYLGRSSASVKRRFYLHHQLFSASFLSLLSFPSTSLEGGQRDLHLLFIHSFLFFLSYVALRFDLHSR